MNHERSRTLFERATKVIPGGVNSPVRAFKSVGGDPLIIERGSGSKIYDVDGNEYIDYVLSWGPLILGHAHPDIVSVIKSAAERGTSYGAPTELEILMAEKIRSIYPSMEKVRAVNSGTEATMSAIRAARGFFGKEKRDKLIKFEGCYHGHMDGLLSKAGSGLATLGIPASLGVPESYAASTITLPYNDLDSIRAVIREDWRNISCVIIEPVAGNMGCVLPKEGFLAGLRKITEEHGIILIFDEVMTGFRVSFGGAQAHYGIRPDMTCLGKVIGAGLPVGAYGGRDDIMSQIAPLGPVYQAGTLSGNPIAMSAGLKCLDMLSNPDSYKRLEESSGYLEAGLKDAAMRAGVPMKFYRAGTMFCGYFTDSEVYDWDTAQKSDTVRFSRYFRGMLYSGINIAPSQYEAGFMSLAHSREDLEKTIETSYKILKTLD